MSFQTRILESIKEVFQSNTVISISGKAGTGKTSLSLYLIGNFFTSFSPYEGSCVWIQASEPFSKKRLGSLFREDSEKLKYLITNFFITPGSGPFTTYDLQMESLKRFSENDFLLPPEIKFIVIDNISHHLRFKFSQISDLSQRSSLINKFYETVLNPLIFRCQREKINLILIHEVSFNVKTQRTRPFLSKLYERIRGVHISLSKSFISNQRTMEIALNNTQISFKFKLTDNGFTFSK